MEIRKFQTTNWTESIVGCWGAFAVEMLRMVRIHIFADFAPRGVRYMASFDDAEKSCHILKIKLIVTSLIPNRDSITPAGKTVKTWFLPGHGR